MYNIDNESEILAARKELNDMTIYKVTYTTTDYNAYFGGGWDYRVTVDRYFTTEEKADEFIANEVMVYVPTWKKEVVAKEKGEGTKTVIEVE